jgi:hypothetical protein
MTGSRRLDEIRADPLEAEREKYRACCQQRRTASPHILVGQQNFLQRRSHISIYYFGAGQ